MIRTSVVTGAASGIGAATARLLRSRGERVIACDLREGDVAADLATSDGRVRLVREVTRISGGRIDAVVANAGGGPPETSLSLNFFGAVATLEGLRPLLAASPAPRAAAVSSIAALRTPLAGLVDACLAGDEAAANAKARAAYDAGELGRTPDGGGPDPVQAGLDLYGAAKRALQAWCRKAAPTADWAGAGITLNVAALGFYDTPAAAFALTDAATRESMRPMFPLAGAFPGRPEEAAALLAWLTSAENSQMTGQLLFADAGAECLMAAGGAR